MVHHGKNTQGGVGRCNGSLSHLIFLLPKNALATEAERTTSEQCAPPVPCQLFTEICQQFAKDGSCNKTWVSGSWLLQSTGWKSCIKFFSPVGTLLYVLLNFPWDLQRAGRFTASWLLMALWWFYWLTVSSRLTCAFLWVMYPWGPTELRVTNFTCGGRWWQLGIR